MRRNCEYDNKDADSSLNYVNHVNSSILRNTDRYKSSISYKLKKKHLQILEALTIGVKSQALIKVNSKRNIFVRMWRI